MILNGIHKFNIMTRLKIRGADRERVSGERTCFCTSRKGSAVGSFYHLSRALSSVGRGISTI